MKELEYPFDPQLVLAKKKRLKKELLASGISFTDKRIAILGGSTTRDFMQAMELFLLNNGIRPEFYESEYNQYYEDGMFDNPELAAFAPDVIYIHTSFRNLLDLPDVRDSREAVKAKEDAAFARFEGLWGHISETYKCPIIQNNFELPFYRLMGNRDAYDYRGLVRFADALNLRFADYADAHANFFIHDIRYEQADYGIAKWSNPFYWHMYKYCCCVPAIPMSAYGTANIIKSIFGKNKKALNLDLDNTLWGGIVGDDGAENIEIGQETSMGQVFSEFQGYVKKQKDIGVILTVNSKNDEANALAGFARPDSVLKREDFVSFKANWEPKSMNLVQTAAELNILPESMVFVDDNPAEREIIRQSVPGAAVTNISQPENYIIELDRSGAFEVTNFSADDVKRSEMYQANAARAQAMTQFADYKDYLKSLEMKAEIKAFAPMYMSRIAQLTNKSNQFNLTTKRCTQAEIEEAAADESRITLYGKLADKFGDNGVVSVVIGKMNDDRTELHIELWLMSCRVLKRDMEKAMLDKLVEKASEKGVKEIYGYYYPTAKNGMVKEFYGVQGFEKISGTDAGDTVWRLRTEGYVRQNEVIEAEP